MNGADNGMLNAVYSAWVEHARQQSVSYAPLGLAPLFCQCEKFYLLKVTAVLTARSNGTLALGESVGGKIVPAEPYLRDPVKHKDPGSNYVTDWLKLANLQLLRSGACFGFDINGLRYVLEPNDDLHERDCGDGHHLETNDFIQQKIASGDIAYIDRLLLIFRWGHDPAERSGGEYSSATAMNILMPGYYEEWVWLDGKKKFGNNLLTHEFGH